MSTTCGRSYHCFLVVCELDCAVLLNLDQIKTRHGSCGGEFLAKTIAKIRDRIVASVRADQLTTLNVINSNTSLLYGPIGQVPNVQLASESDFVFAKDKLEVLHLADVSTTNTIGDRAADICVVDLAVLELPNGFGAD